MLAAALDERRFAYTTNGLNQLSQRGGTTLTYDARGNLTSDGATTYAYTSENHLKSASNGVSLYYDALGRLVEYDTSISLRHVYDGNVITADIDNPSGVVTRRYVHGPGVDEVLALYEGPYSNDKRWFHNDERGSIGAISGPGGTAFAINRYDEYGNPNPQTGRYGYTGQVWLDGLGTWYYKARIYNPKLGRFMQSDPIGYGAGVNLYAYVGGDPINFIDPLGLANLDIKPIDPNDNFQGEVVVTGSRSGFDFDLNRFLGAIGNGGFGGTVGAREPVDANQPQDICSAPLSGAANRGQSVNSRRAQVRRELRQAIERESRTGREGALQKQIGRNTARLTPNSGTWIRGGTTRADGNFLYGAITSELGISLSTAIVFGDVAEFFDDVSDRLGFGGVPDEGMGRDTPQARAQIAAGSRCPG